MIRIKRLVYSKSSEFKVCIDDLHILPGEKVLMIGPSGSGKSTVLRLIAGLETAQQGNIILKDIDTQKTPLPPHRRRIALLSQDYGLWPHMKVIEHVSFARNKGKHLVSDESDHDLLKMVHLKDKKDQYPGRLSGGEQQRLALARALAARPEILLLDEPFSNLDMVLSDELAELTDTICKSRNLTIIQVSHEKIRLNKAADRIIIVENGQIVQQGSWEEIASNPVTTWTQKSVGLMR